MDINFRESALLLLSAMTLGSSVATADFTVHYTDSTSEPVPTSLQEAIDEDFYFIFDSYYYDADVDQWFGDTVGLIGTYIFGDIIRDCRLQLGGYLWQEGDDPKVVRLAVAHGTTTKLPENGDPFSPECLDGIELEFDNGVVMPGYPAASAGGWVAEATAAQVNAGAFAGTFFNVQVDALGGNVIYCSTNRGGSGGDIDVSYNENPVGDAATFSFAANIVPPSFLLSCFVDGVLYSVEKANITMPNPGERMPGTPHPSPASRGIVDSISNP